jgi:hypothetical protein
MLKKIILIIVVSVIGLSVNAQVKRKIKKSRRNKSDSQFTLDSAYLQAEWEFGEETINADVSTTSYPNLLLRYGVDKRTEINAEVSMVSAKDASSGEVLRTNGIEPVMLGMNYLLCDETKDKVAVILSAQIAIPFLASSGFTANLFAPTIQATFYKPINKKTVFALSNGIFWDGFSTVPSYIYNANLTYNITSNWQLTTEIFGFINSSPPLHNADVNISYQFNKQLQMGFTAGTGLSEAAHKSYFAMTCISGFSMVHKKMHQPIKS